MKGVRGSSAFFASLLLLALLLGAEALHARLRVRGARAELALQRELVRRLELTDVCLFTEARYTRHLSQADSFSAFQDHPRALEHFPSGSLVARPRSP